MFDDLVPITISDRAAAEIRNIMENKNIPAGYGLRVGVKGGGCGVSLLIGFDKQKEADRTYIVNGIQVYVDRKHAMYIIGKEIDFVESDEARGFMFADQPSKSSINAT
ncbi:MAG: iron-sulfur cluster assembly accessory protein [Chryseolinea sp.]